MAYRPALPFNVALVLLIPSYETISGVRTKVYPEIENGINFFGTFRTFGGTDIASDGVLVIEDTASVETWYRPDITGSCRIAVAGSQAVYDVIGEPENIEMRNQFLSFKVKRVKGGA